MRVSCEAICDSFEPGFQPLRLPSYNPLRHVVTGNMVWTDPLATESSVGMVEYIIYVDLSFNIDC